MAAARLNSTKMISSQMRIKANEFLNSRKNLNNLPDLLELFNEETDNYSALILTLEVIFIELWKRGDLCDEVEPLKPEERSAENEYKTWLEACYETAWNQILLCFRIGCMSSRLQAVVTASKLLQAEGRYETEPTINYFFPSKRLKSIFTALLDPALSMVEPIGRFQEFCEYADVQQYGLRILHTMVYKKSPTNVYIQNYLELFDKLLTSDISDDPKRKAKKGKDASKPDEPLCYVEGKPKFTKNEALSRRYANRAWGFACQWPLCEESKTRRRALILLVERLMPILFKPHLATDMLCDCLDSGGSTSMLALQGVLELIRRHNINYPDIYDRLYSMFEPEIFATRTKDRLIHLADIFLSSTHLPESVVAAFCKRVSRLALVASPEDGARLLQLAANLLLRHPGLKRMLCYQDAPQIMSADPYIMEETVVAQSRALGSSLWEVVALERHWLPALSKAATKLLSLSEGTSPVVLAIPDDHELYDAELKSRFRAIEMNFVRLAGMTLSSGERLQQHWDLTV